MVMYASSSLFGWRRFVLTGVFVLGLPLGGAQAADSKPPATGAAAKTATAAKKPASSTKKGPTKKASSEWHGEAAPRDVVPGEKVLEALLDLGNGHLNAGRYEQAIKVFTEAAQRAPLEPKPLYMRGICYQKTGQLKEAEADFRDALTKDPKGHDEQTVKVRVELGAVLTDSGRPAEAVDLLEQSAREKPDLFEAQYNLGVAHEALKHWPEAIAAYTRATKLKPTDSTPRANQSDAFFNLGAVLRKSGRLEESIAPTREAVQLAPDNPHTHLSLGLLLSDAKRYDEAVTEMTATIALAEGLTRSAPTPEEKNTAKQLLHKAWWRLGVVHIRRESPKEAISALETAKGLQPTAEVLTDLGLAFQKANNLPRAEAEWRAALQMNPNLTAARLHLAAMLANTGRCSEGLTDLNLVPNEPFYAETINRIKQRCDYEREMQARGRK